MSEKVKVIHDQDKVAGVLAELCERLGHLIADPPYEGYGDGYDVVHIVGIHENWDTGDQTISTVNPFQLERAHAATHEDIEPIVRRMLDPRSVEGMTQGFIILRR